MLTLSAVPPISNTTLHLAHFRNLDRSLSYLPNTAALRPSHANALPPFLAFTSYGGFWLAYSAFLHPSYGVAAAYTGKTDELTSAIGIFLSAWFIITFLFL